MSFTQREARRIIRKAVGRVPEGEEIRHLNIVPMMDMMTILLVAFIYQAAAPAAELLIIADRTTPYRLLIEVLFSAKQKEAGYKHFRLIVQKSFPSSAPRK